MAQHKSFVYEFSTDVPADTPLENPIEVERDVPQDGWITSIIVGWPDGADNRVGVGVGTETGENLFPRNKEDQFIAANSFTSPFDVRVEVSEDDTLVARYMNHDTDNDHFVNVFVTIEESLR